MRKVYLIFFSFSEPHKKEKIIEIGEYFPCVILLFNYDYVLNSYMPEVNILFLFVFTLKTAKKEVKVHGKS